MRSLRVFAAALLFGLPAAIAQTPLSCDHQNSNGYCEVREINLPFAGALDVRTGGVGAIAVRTWENAYVLVRAQVNSDAGDEYQSRLAAMAVQLDTSAGRVWASGPYGKSWAVAYEVFVPRECELRLYTKVGAISVADVAAKIDVETGVGAITLSGLAGDVEARTGVGAIAVVLGGERWDGKGLAVTTGMGAIHISAAPGYSADFELRTGMGGIVTNFPGARVKSSGMFAKKLVFAAGRGGAKVQATTSMGQIELKAVERP